MFTSKNITQIIVQMTHHFQIMWNFSFWCIQTTCRKNKSQKKDAIY